MTPKEESQKLIEKFIPQCYCFLGSGMLTNTYDERVAQKNAINCAIIAVDELIKWMPNKTDWDKRTIALMEANGDNPSDFEWDQRYGVRFWKQVKQELEQL